MTHKFPDHYKILDIPFDASQNEIKQAFRKKAKESHPDIGGSGEEFINIRKAYEVLKDPERKRIYDIMYQKYYQEKQQESYTSKKQNQSYHQEKQTKHEESKTRSQSSKSNEHESRGPEHKEDNSKVHTTPLRVFLRVAGIATIALFLYVQMGMSGDTETSTIEENISYNSKSKSESSVEGTETNTEENSDKKGTQADKIYTEPSDIEGDNLETDVDMEAEEEVTDIEPSTEKSTNLPTENPSNTMNEEQENEDHQESFTSAAEQSGSFSLGSTQEQVKSVMGAPSSISSYNNSWEYEYSSIKFDSNNKVIGWSNISNNLETYLGDAEANATFTLGSTKQEVVNAMGTPTSISSYNNEWSYDHSTLRFNDNHQVIGWSNISDNLRTHLGDALPNTTFTVGSSKKEVIEAMGTPTSVSTYVNSWDYKYSTVRFDENDKVVSWSDISQNLKIR